MSQLRAFRNTISRYFTAYGRWRAIFGSPYFLGAVGLATVDYARWISASWVDLTTNLIPSLLGFSLGTYAIIFSLITNRIKRAMKAIKNNDGVSYLDVVNSTFFHFILVQVLAFVWAILFEAKAIRVTVNYILERGPISQQVAEGARLSIYYGSSFLGYVLLLYSFLLVMAAAMAVYRLANITDPAE